MLVHQATSACEESFGEAVQGARVMYSATDNALIVVVEEIDGRRVPRGIVTDRDIVLRAICETPSTCMGETAVADIMTPDLITAREREDLADVFARMRAFGVRRIPIVDDDGGLQGIVSFDDVLEWSSEQMRDFAELLSRERENEGARDRSRRR